MNLFRTTVLLLLAIVFYTCAAKKIEPTTEITFDLSDTVKKELSQKIDTIDALDQKYRGPISIGTLNPEVLKKDAELSKKGNLPEYIAFRKTVEKDLSKEQIDSLWKLQHALDYKNYQELKAMVQQYGYPSKERLGVQADKLYAVLLHPPIELEPEEYLKEMSSLLLPEVEAKRMKAISYAMFYDNIKTKVMKQPQLYGTSKTFNPATMKEGLPKIKDLEQTNTARTEIGLEPLKEGEFELDNKD